MSKRIYYHECKGFTLAEVLIVLGIIGVVAALTIPTLIANYRQKEFSTRIKKVYTILEQAVMRAEADYGDSTDWDAYTQNNAQEILDKYFLPYIQYYQVKNDEIFLKDGTIIRIGRGSCLDFVVDINGNKKPNLSGYDIFMFPFCMDDHNRLFWNGNAKKSLGAYEGLAKTKDEALELCKQKSGYCTRLLQFNNWEFTKEYPYKL